MPDPFQWGHGMKLNIFETDRRPLFAIAANFYKILAYLSLLQCNDRMVSAQPEKWHTVSNFKASKYQMQMIEDLSEDITFG